MGWGRLKNSASRHWNKPLRQGRLRARPADCRRHSLTVLSAPSILAAFFFRGLAHHGNEAYVSTEQPPAQAHARLPRPHADQGRTGRPLAPSPQGSQAPRCLSGRSRQSRWNAFGPRRCRDSEDWQSGRTSSESMKRAGSSSAVTRSSSSPGTICRTRGSASRSRRKSGKRTSAIV
jgi:hypothetical protein